MKNQTTTRFTVGMPVIYINDGVVIKAKIDTVTKPKDVMGNYPIVISWEYEGNNYESETFTNGGYKSIVDDYPCLFTLPEYEALKKLTDSFVDGTFGKEQTKPQDNPIVSTKPFETTEWGKKNKPTEKPTPISGEWKETIDLLDEKEQPVYFEIGMKVGHLGTEMTGMVCRRDNSTKEVCVDFDSDIKWFTFDGKVQDSNIQAIYPIAQYNQIQLPKLQPIQVPKEDVIELPSWFKGGVVIEKKSVFDYIISLGRDIEDVFDGFMEKAYIELKECVFYSCMIKDLSSCNKSKLLIIDFVYRNTYYTMVIDFNNLESKHTELLMAYQKNGKDVSEKLC
jgi:hypothetical protein